MRWIEFDSDPFSIYTNTHIEIYIYLGALSYLHIDLEVLVSLWIQLICRMYR